MRVETREEWEVEGRGVFIQLKNFRLQWRLVPLGSAEMDGLLQAYVFWYATERPHQGLGGRTPLEMFDGARPAHHRPRLEPRARYPASAPSAAPRAPVRGKRGARIELILSHPTGASHLPVVRLRRAA